ncbi:MAG: DegV family protein [Marvinbryantia sp.]|jgi:DegV family protein with EDD domain
MSSYVVTTDTSADLPEQYYQEHQMIVIPLSCILDGETYVRGAKELSMAEFYAKMREGKMPTTSQANPEQAKKIFEPLIKEGKDILHIAFSSGLSGTCGSARIAAEELMEEYPERKIIVVDSLCASLGQGLLVHKTLEKQKEGLSLEELAAWCEEMKMHIIHSFTVDDLFHLYRGGRLSKAAAVIGTMIQLKPVLHVNNEGKLIPLSKVRSRKKSLQALVAAMEAKQGSFAGKNDVIFISHGDCVEDAEYVKALIEEKFGIHNFIISPVGNVIGAHSGPGTLALFFLGDNRE